MIRIDSADKFDSNLQVCYEILLYLSSRIARLETGEVFEFVSGDADAEQQIIPWCDARGYTLLESNLSPDGRFRFLIQK